MVNIMILQRKSHNQEPCFYQWF